MPGDVVVALEIIDAAQHGRIGAPAVPEKLDDGNHDRQDNALDRAQYGHAGEADQDSQNSQRWIR